MKSIIMAGGMGSRLRPLTCDRPKPLVPVLGRPVMEYALRLLASHGVREAAATLCYLPGQVEDCFGDGSRYGLRLRYYRETEPLGTAGGVRRAADFLDETFCVLSGDGLTSCDLSAALAFHRERGALATIVLRRAAEPTRYGVAVTEPDGRIRAFLEKPDWSDVFSDLVNTGIYILEPEALRLVPEGCPCDFSRDLFPEMLRRGLPVFGWETREYWCDIGDIDSYLAAHRAVLSGEAGVGAPLDPSGITVEPGARVSGRARMEGPVWIGQGAVIEENAEIGPWAVIGEGARVARGARVRRGVLWRAAQLEEGAQLSGGVLADGASLEARACAFEGSVIGARSTVGEEARVMPGVRVWPRKALEAGACVEEDVVWGSGEGLRCAGGWLRVRDPAQAARVGQALGPGRVLVGRTAGGASLCCARALVAGLLFGGAEALECGAAPLPALRLQARLLGVDRAVWVDGRRVLPLTGAGGELTNAGRGELERAIRREEVPTLFADAVHAPQGAGDARLLYLGDIARGFPAVPRRRGAAIQSRSPALLALAQEAFARAGWQARAEWDGGRMQGEPGEWRVWLEEDGSAAIGDWEERPGPEWQDLLRAWTAFERGARRYAVSGGPVRAIEALAERYGARVDRVHSGRGEEQEALAAIAPELLRLRTDGVYMALAALDALERAGLGLADWRGTMPPVAVAARGVPVPERGGVLRALAAGMPEAELADGLHIETDAARVSVRPAADRSECLVSCEARDAETAAGLCDLFVQKVRGAARGEPTGPA